VTNPISGSSGSESAAAPAGMKGLDRNAFLQLLVTQLGHQNPLQPQADGEFIAQLAQFSSLEQLTQIQSTLGRMATAMGVPSTTSQEQTGSTSSGSLRA
jgi:flagellar basal-body rod modification protein FlgD